MRLDLREGPRIKLTLASPPERAVSPRKHEQDQKGDPEEQECLERHLITPSGAWAVASETIPDLHP
jgi:hypothetical protein